MSRQFASDSGHDHSHNDLVDIEKDAEIGFSPSSSSSNQDSGEKKSPITREAKRDEAGDEDDQDNDEPEEEEIEDARIRETQGEGAQEDGDTPQPPTGGILQRVLSRASTSRSRYFDPGPPPDGGWRAWVMTACTHLVIMDTWGVINSFGTFQTYYTTTLNRTPSDISWIGSFQIFLLFFIGTFTGRLTDAGYFRILLAVGTVLQIVGIFATAQATQYWHFFLAQGVVMGLGNGCLFCPSLATLSTYFSTRRSLAIGITAAGSATGGLIFPSIVRQLLPKLGFPWTMRVIGFVQLGTLLLANAFLRTRLPPRRTGRIVEWSAFKEPQYTFYAAGSFTCFWGVYVAFFYLGSFSRDAIGLSYTDSLNLLLVLNGVGAAGRLLPNYFADRFGVLNMFVLFGLYCGVTALAWMAVRSTAGLYVWSVFYGFAAGGIQSLFPAGLTSLTRDLSKAGVRMGMVFTINSLATLTGPPICGAIIAADGGSYRGAQIFTGVVLLVGTVFMTCARLSLSRSTGKGWRAKV